MSRDHRDDDFDDLPLDLGRGGGDPPAAAGRGAGGPVWDPDDDFPDDLSDGEAPLGPPPRVDPDHRRAGGGAPSRLPWLLLGFLALVVFVGLAFLAGYRLPRPGPPILRVEPALVDLGEVRVGTAGEPVEVEVSARGERPVTVSEVRLGGRGAEAIRVASDGCSGSTLAPGRSCTVILQLTPGDAEPARATLEVASSASNGVAAVSVVGQGTEPRPFLRTTLVQFPAQPVGSAGSPEVVVLGNRGSAPFEVPGVRVAGQAGGDFTLAGDRCTGEVLAPGDECSVEVLFTPSREGQRLDSLQFRAGGEGSLPEIPLVALAGNGTPAGPENLGAAGAAAAGREPGAAAGPPAAGRPAPAPSPTPAPPAPTPAPTPSPTPPPKPPPAPKPAPAPPDLRVEPASLDFGEERVGAAAAARSLVVRNAGGSAGSIEGVRLRGEDAGSFEIARNRCRGELDPGERCTVEVGFRPAQEGRLGARLEIAREGERALGVDLTGAGAAARLGVAPAALAFGRVAVTATADRPVALVNTGRAPLEIRGVTVSGPGREEFRVTQDRCSGTLALAPDERCELTVRFAPRGEGERAATLVVRHDGLGVPGEVALSGVAVPPPAPRPAVTPGQLAFGSVPAGRRSDILTVTLANRGDARLTLGPVRIAGRDPEDFRLVHGSCEGATALSPGGSCTVGVQFVPRSPGARRARLILRHGGPGGETAVELAGDGED